MKNNIAYFVYAHVAEVASVIIFRCECASKPSDFTRLRERSVRSGLGPGRVLDSEMYDGPDGSERSMLAGSNAPPSIVTVYGLAEAVVKLRVDRISPVEIDRRKGEEQAISLVT
ncbi:hypothetical protein N7512_002923 [Penicillium capsulatum]|nr:hypothetical protein N7512_002923 [Penicillium capsulatum]